METVGVASMVAAPVVEGDTDVEVERVKLGVVLFVMFGGTVGAASGLTDPYKKARPGKGDGPARAVMIEVLAFADITTTLP